MAQEFIDAKNSRIKAVENFRNVDQNVFLNQSDKNNVEKSFEEARIAYEKARADALPYWYAIYYRALIFGSARLEHGSQDYEDVKNLAKQLVIARDMDVITGGGPGLMEAANEGLEEAVNESQGAAKNVGINIFLPHEKGSNRFVHFNSTHENFSTRIQQMVDLSNGCYAGPGGFGTAREILDILQQRQVGHLEKDYPVIFHPQWEKPIEDLYDLLYHKRDDFGEEPLVSEGDLEGIKFTKDIGEIVEIFSLDFDGWNQNVRSKLRLTNGGNIDTKH